jgi:hypothetical protein
MGAPADNEITVLAVLAAYVILGLAFAWLMTRRADRLIAEIRHRDPEGLWKDLGSPRDLREATRDPQRRWTRLLRNGRYRSKCSPGLSARIDDFVRHLNGGLLVLTALGVGILYTYWDVIGPKLF